MHKPVATFVVALAMVSAAVSQAAASDKTDVMATVHQYCDSLNKGDTKTAVALCLAPSFIIDEFPPHGWQGATACADWVNDFETYNKNNGISDSIVTLGKPKHVDITGDRAYVVVPATYTYKQHGKRMKESGSFLTVALQKVAAGWRISGWSWTKG